ncbi:MAG: DoxX family protein [Deltaproteobacteria bacterium]|nr:MAG: DoxX family protein [Deltaproteobacteria bacterium]
MNTGLWVAQVLLAIAFGMAGAMKTFTAIDDLSQTLPWVRDDLALLVRFIGVSELLGAAGLILPAATRIQPRLTPLAAAGITVIMVLATGFHIVRGEFSALPVTLVLGALAGFVAWGRWKKVPIAPRS